MGQMPNRVQPLVRPRDQPMRTKATGCFEVKRRREITPPVRSSGDVYEVTSLVHG